MERWPRLAFQDWVETGAALHLYSQIVGKYRLAHTPWLNHSWHATLYPTPRGLTTGPIPDPAGPAVVLFDFVDDVVRVELADRRAEIALEPMSVAAFYEAFRGAVRSVGGTPTFHGAPNEVADPIPFAADKAPRPFHRDAVRRWHGAILSASEVFEAFRTAFLGKCSPVHLFWGSFDLAVTRFSGQPAPRHPGGIPALPDAITHEAYSHEVMSAGFWAGGNGVDEAMFYAYAYPTPDGFADGPIAPEAARWDDKLGEFLLPYEAVRTARDPAAALMDFLNHAYSAAADRAGWDRAALDAPVGVPRVPRAVPSS